MTICIRQATDLDLIRSGRFLMTWCPQARPTGTGPILTRRRHNIFGCSIQVTYVAEEDQRILGTYYLKTNHDGPGPVCNCGYMVAPAARGRGLATRMCEHSQQEAVRMGYQAMQFNFVAASNEGAVRLWTKLGFATVGRLPALLRIRSWECDALVMYKWLAA